MAYTISDPQSGFLALTALDAGILTPYQVESGGTTYIPTPPLYPGKIITAVDPTYGGAEFILLLGVAGTSVGTIVTYNQATFQTALAPVGANLPQPVAIAMSANLAATWGWYQIAGIAVANKSASTSLAVNAAVGIATAGLVAASATSNEVEGCLVAVVATATATTVQLVLNRPHMLGRIT